MTSDRGANRAERTLVAALRTFIQEVSEPKAPDDDVPKPARGQALYVALFAADVVLLLAVFSDEVLESRLVRLAAKVVPAVLGGLLLAYLDAVRQTLFGWARKKWFRRAMVALFVPLILYHALVVGAQLPLFSIAIRTTPDYAMVYRDGIPSAGGLRSISGLPFRTHRLVVKHRSSTDAALSDTVTVSRTDLARALIGRIPAIGRLAASGPIPLAPRYQLKVRHGVSGGWLEIHGNFTHWFLRSSGSLFDDRVFVAREDSEGAYIAFPMDDGAQTENIYLPPGVYRLRFCGQDYPDSVRVPDPRPSTDVRRGWVDVGSPAQCPRLPS